MKDELRNFGFSEKEADIYLALFKLGLSKAADIAKHARINRSTAYVVLESLAERGLINATEERGVRRYSPMPAEDLAGYLESQAKQYKAFAANAKKLVPELKSLQKSAKQGSLQPKVKFLEGDQAVKTVYEDTLASLEAIRTYASIEGKSKQGAKTHVIFSDTPGAKAKIAESKEEAKEAFHIPSEAKGLSTEINIYDDKIIFVSPTEKFVAVVESRELARALKQAFESARKEASPKKSLSWKGSDLGKQAA
jgi:sugar-specific transcriptional regulator TrmB